MIERAVWFELVTGSESAPLPASVSFAGPAALLMLLTWNSLGCRHTGEGPAFSGAPAAWIRVHLLWRERGATSDLIRLVSQKLCRYTSVVSPIRPPSVHLLYHLLGWQIILPRRSPKLYFFFVSSQQELNRISIQTFLTPVASSDRRFITLL